MNKIRLYTIQHETAYLNLIKTGVLNVTDESLIDPDFLLAYKWLVGQMAKRIENFSGHYPIWAWTKRGYHTNVKEWTTPNPLVFLAVDVPVNRVLLSDFSAWHFVLNGWYLSKSEEDLEKDLSPLQIFSKEEKEKSWELIFEKGPGECGWGDEWQATIDQVFANEIVFAKKIR